jgi:hypothetical protein
MGNGAGDESMLSVAKSFAASATWTMDNFKDVDK